MNTKNQRKNKYKKYSICHVENQCGQFFFFFYRTKVVREKSKCNSQINNSSMKTETALGIDKVGN
jgi:hypothetical protein